MPTAIRVSNLELKDNSSPRILNERKKFWIENRLKIFCRISYNFAVLLAASDVAMFRRKGAMPAVRNDILMLLAHKKAAELQERAGKVALAREIRRAAMKPLDDSDAESDDDAPVRAVHFSSFIIQ